MDAVLAIEFQSLSKTLQELNLVYCALFDLLVRERDFLISADVKSLDESNRTKTAILNKLKLLDFERETKAEKFSVLVGVEGHSPRLLEIVKKCQKKGHESESKKLLDFHSGLRLIIERVTELNKDNEVYALSGLNALNRALAEVKETLSGKKTYEKKGMLKKGPHQAGNFVSKEA
jgi:hypothetical protein